MDIGRAFTFVFEDDEWIKKVAIGAVLMLLSFLVVPVLPVMGYAAEVLRRVVRDDPQVLPEWEDWGALFKQGLMIMVVGLVWALPIIIISSCVAIPAAVMGDSMDPDTAGIISAVAGVCVGLVSLIYGLIMGLVLPAAIAQYVVTGEFGAAFRFGEVIGLVRNNLVTYLMVLLASVLANFVGGLGAIIVGCGLFITMFYSVLVTFHAYGQAYRTAIGHVESEVQYDY